MFDGFTERAKLTMARARQEAIRLGHDYIDAEHVLLGLLQEETSTAVRVLRALGVDLERLRQEVDAALPTLPPIDPKGQLPITSRAEEMLEHTMMEASQLDHRTYGTEQFLLGLIRDDVGPAGPLLRASGATLEATRKAIRRQHSQDR